MQWKTGMKQGNKVAVILVGTSAFLTNYEIDWLAILSFQMREINLMRCISCVFPLFVLGAVGDQGDITDPEENNAERREWQETAGERIKGINAWFEWKFNMDGKDLESILKRFKELLDDLQGLKNDFQRIGFHKQQFRNVFWAFGLYFILSMVIHEAFEPLLHRMKLIWILKLNTLNWINSCSIPRGCFSVPVLKQAILYFPRMLGGFRYNLL